MEREAAALSGVGLTVDLGSGLDLDAAGVVVSAVQGASEVDGGVNFPVAAGSKITWRGRNVGGVVLVRGGIALAAGAKKVVASNLSVDLDKGVLTGSLGGRRNVRIGTAADVSHAEVVKDDGASTATLILADGGFELTKEFITVVNEALGTAFATGADTEVLVDASLSVDVDLAKGNAVNTGLVRALGLEDEIDPELGHAGLLDAGLDLQISLL
ncbi:hypothetical protein [Nocardia bovistercoris]|uniref:Uncharacterized protein n=1 Tax=Nocardia bovistercoris TaxID=2785916 RepID=A0A931IIG6_9NOCA|nr:hypothetical protein [Nocardia bovistercoris]MBH0780960.1 hypothetical protein [Nocardia bovistercoris]